MSIKLGCVLKSEETLESARKTFTADLSSNVNVPIVFDRSCHCFLIKALI